MRRTIRCAATALLAASALAVAGCGRGGTTSGASPGVTASTIAIGGDAPLSGPIAGYGVDDQAAAAYFDYVNAHGGVKMADGIRRKIRFTYYDDAYEPDRALQNAERLVGQNHVFAMFGVVGTPPAEAMRPFLNANRVPETFTLSSTTAISGDYRQYPWTVGWPLSFAAESAIEAEYLKQTHPHARVAILYVNNDGGEDLLNGFKQAIARSGIRIVGTQPYVATDASVQSQMAALAATKATVFYDISTSKYTAQAVDDAANLGWHPLHLLDSVGADATVLDQAGASQSQGIRSVTFLKDPTDPRWAADPSGIGLYKQVIAQYGHGINPDNTLAVLGVAAAESFVQVLERSRPTRRSLMYQLRHLDGLSTPLLDPGVTMHTSPADPFPIESAVAEAFDHGTWHDAGPVLSDMTQGER